MSPAIQMILPVYNEREALPLVLAEWDKMFRREKIGYQFIICEDGSSDGTKELLKMLERKYPIKLNQKDYRRGYGGAIIEGLDDVTAEYILCIDSDGQCDPMDFKRIWEARNPERVCIGWRVSRKDNTLRLIYSSMFYGLFWLLFQGRIHDPSCPFIVAPVKVFRENVSLLRMMREGFWWGLSAICYKKNIEMREFPVEHRERLAGVTRVYALKKMPGIIWRNVLGLFRIRFA